MPGGLIEAIEIARGSTADLAAVSVMQFSRIAVTVTAVPLIFAVVEGRAVGSAAGESIGSAAPLSPVDAAVLIGCAVVGFVVARAVKLPAGQIVGPIIASATAHGVGLTEAAPPVIVVAIAQLVIGITLGLRFQGLEPRDLMRFLGLSVVSVAAMLGLGVLLALPVAAMGTAPMAVMVLSLAPGGVVEMGLIALSLQASPIFVTAHHLVRILLTVAVAAAGWQRLGPRS
jgi:membrane AbrB-like protein